MILCVTPNPAIDRVMVVPGLRLGKVHRIPGSLVMASGKGLNVARAIRILGGSALSAGFLGGHDGRLLAGLAEQEGLPGSWTPIEGQTRTCTILVDPEKGEATVINEAGPAVSAAEWARLQADVLEHAAQASGLSQTSCVCFSGSLPMGDSPAAFAALLRALVAARRQVWVDSSAEGLQAALSAGPVGVKVNGLEAGEMLGMEVSDAASALQAAARLRNPLARPVVLTLGKAGAVMVTDEGGWLARPPEVQAVSAVGSGDSFLAGLVTSLEAGHPNGEALRRAAAAGAANALSPGSGRFEYSDFEKILGETRLEQVRP